MICLRDRAPRAVNTAILLLVALLLLVACTCTAAVTCPSDSSVIPVDPITHPNLGELVGSYGPDYTFELDQGNYTFWPPINLSSGTTCIRGTSPDQVVVNVAGSSGTAITIANAGSNLSLQGLTLNGQGGDGILVAGGSVDITNVRLQKFDSALSASGLDVENVSLNSVAFRENGVNHSPTCSLQVNNKSFAWDKVEFSDAQTDRGAALVVSGADGPTSLTISGDALFLNNPGRAITVLNTVNPVQLTFTGNADFLDNSASSSYVNSGAAMFLSGSASVTFTGSLTMENNVAHGAGGGAVLVNGASLVASGPTFLLNNHATDQLGSALPDGGVVHLLTNSFATSDTTASFLGPLVVQGNTARGDGGAFYLSGLENQTVKSKITISDQSVFANNSAIGSGGAVASTSGTVFQVIGNGSILMQGNTAASGGGIYSNGQIILNSSSNNMANNSPDDVVLANGGTVDCLNTSLNNGTYHITGPVCSCATADGGNVTCGCPAQYVWDAANGTCTAAQANSFCGNVNGTGVPYQCTGNYVYNPAAANKTELSLSSCCLWQSTCQTAYIDSNMACARGVYNPATSNQLNPNLYTCCQDSCADSNIRSSPARPWPCTRGAYDASKASSPKPSNSVCCQPTCGDTNLNSPTPIRYNCTGQWQFNPLSANVTVLSNKSCCTLSEANVTLRIVLATTVPVVAVGESITFTINVLTVAADGRTGVAVDLALITAIPTGLSVETASLPAGCVATRGSHRTAAQRMDVNPQLVVCNAFTQYKMFAIRAAAAAAGEYPIYFTASSPSVTDPSVQKVTVRVQGACCSNTTGLCQAAASAADCVGGSFLPDKSCATAECPAPQNGPRNFTINRTTSVDAKDIAVGNVVDVKLAPVLENGSNAASLIGAQVSVTGRVQFIPSPIWTASVGSRAAGCKIEALHPKNNKTGVTQRLSCTGSMQQGQNKTLTFSFLVLEAGAATIRSRMAIGTVTNKDVFTFTSRGACCLGGSTKTPSCRDMAPAECKAARGKPDIKHSCAHAACKHGK